MIGTKDVDDATNTRIVISGNTRASPYNGNIDYVVLPLITILVFVASSTSFVPINV